MTEVNATDKGRDGRADFDFVVGQWAVHNRRRRGWLTGSDSWEEFEGTSVARTVLGGLGNIDEITLERASGRQEGVTVRLYDPVSRLWSLYWAGVDGILQAPLIGGFEGGRGTFFAHEIFEGKSVFSRFIWSDITDTACRWEQAFSPDGGTTGEINWIMELTRRG